MKMLVFEHVVVRFLSPLAPGIDSQRHVSWGTHLACSCSGRCGMELAFENVHDTIKVDCTVFDISKRVKNFHAYLTRNYSQKNVHVCGLIGQYSADCQR